MCNRYRIKEVMEVQAYALRLFNVMLELSAPRWNVAPNQVLPIIVADDSSQPVATIATWNLVPFFEKSPRPAILRTNARSEEAFTKASYRDGLQHRRCLVPSDGFYEWEHLHDGKVKLPWLFELENSAPFSYAGIWEKGNGLRPPSFTILTTRPNELVGKIHTRMPVLLDEANAQRWLSQGPITPESLQQFSQPYPADAMRSHRVNSQLNSVRNDSAEAASPYVAANSDEPMPAKDGQAEFILE